MKWFKYDTDAFMSEGIDALMDADGFAGYGRWVRVLEIVALKMDETDRCHAEYSIKKWCRLLGLKQKKLISFLKLTENQLKTKVVYSENIIRIEIPNLLKKRDNYTKHLVAPKKKLVSKDIEVDKEVEVDNKKKDILVFDFSAIWKRYPNKDGKKAAERHFNATVKKEKDWTDINQALDNYINHTKNTEKRFIKNGSTWFNNWQDWIDWKEPKQQTSKFTGLHDKDYGEVSEDGSVF